MLSLETQKETELLKQLKNTSFGNESTLTDSKSLSRSVLNNSKSPLSRHFNDFSSINIQKERIETIPVI